MPKEKPTSVVDIRFVYKEPFMVKHLNEMASDRSTKVKQIMHDAVVDKIKEWINQRASK